MRCAHSVSATSRIVVHAARNRGVERARGEVLVFTDPDKSRL